jgi:ABC-type arginine transport system ATPase subunit
MVSESRRSRDAAMAVLRRLDCDRFVDRHPLSLPAGKNRSSSLHQVGERPPL